MREASHVIDKMSVFKVLTDKQKNLLKERSTIAHYKKNEIIYKEGDKPDRKSTRLNSSHYS